MDLLQSFFRLNTFTPHTYNTLKTVWFSIAKEAKGAFCGLCQSIVIASRLLNSNIYLNFTEFILHIVSSHHDEIIFSSAFLRPVTHILPRTDLLLLYFFDFVNCVHFEFIVGSYVAKKHWVLYSPVPRLSFAHRFDTKLREMSFEKQNSAKAVLFTMYVSTAGAKTFYHRKT